MATEESRYPGKMFLNCVPPKFLRELYDLVCREHVKARRQCEHLPGPQARYLTPHTRRANIQAGLKDLAAHFPNVSAEDVPNEAGECHVVVAFEKVRMTVSHVDHASRPTRAAKFRRTYAEDSQPCLFDCGDRPSPGQCLYALALHGGSDELTFLNIVFPIPSDLKGGIRYHSDRIHLARMFAEQPGERRHDEDKGPEIREEPGVG